MIDLLAIGKTAFEAGKGLLKAYQDHEEKKKEKTDEERMQTVIEDFRRRIATGRGGNCLKPPVGSEEDRFYSKMANKGMLVRHIMGGYMLPEMSRHQGGLY